MSDSMTYPGSPATDCWGNQNTFVCDTCMYFVEKRLDIGRCRRHSPNGSEGWPAVYRRDFCGDHKISPERLSLFRLRIEEDSRRRIKKETKCTEEDF